MQIIHVIKIKLVFQSFYASFVRLTFRSRILCVDNKNVRSTILLSRQIITIGYFWTNLSELWQSKDLTTDIDINVTPV